MEDDGKEKKKKENYPSLPSNYVTLVQLQERWLKEKERKQREKEQEEEDERRRKLQLQKKLEEEERKRKLGPQRLEGGVASIMSQGVGIGSDIGDEIAGWRR
ncbi:hypothetical protein SLA2020_432100 [Shorea laevis]